ncbi:hypothetical protein LIER_39058 [Lithospermum erythrorhizon]|uniref:MORF/ORRM1/DAG-like MORF domain-containing protein n=1 Tax=Lithospermum erythrorhizon TaxID=34254 RepID=A0AAV3Q9R2_LITER
MFLSASRLRRATSLFHHHHPTIPPLTPTPSRLSTSTNTSTSPPSQSSSNNTNNETNEISPNSVLFEGCDFNHWLIVVDFTKHPIKPSSQEMLKVYENTATKIFGSLEEAKKKIYACSTTAYTGFQVECSVKTSEKFKDLHGVTYVLPDSYIDAVSKEYGGDKYIDGQIFPRPPAFKYGRLVARTDLKNHPCVGTQTEGEHRNLGPPGTRPSPQNFDSPPPSHQPPQKNYGQASRAQRYYGPPQNFPQQNYGSHSRQIYGPPRGGVNSQGSRRD